MLVAVRGVGVQGLGLRLRGFGFKGLGLVTVRGVGSVGV